MKDEVFVAVPKYESSKEHSYAMEETDTSHETENHEITEIKVSFNHNRKTKIILLCPRKKRKIDYFLLF